MPSKKIPEKRKQQAHNALFNETFINKKYGLDIFRLVFKPSEFKLFNWKTLKPEMTVFMDEEGNEKRIDLLFSVQVKGSKKQVRIFFLLEHKSHQDPQLLKQVLGYQTCIYKSLELSGHPHPCLSWTTKALERAVELSGLTGRIDSGFETEIW